MKSVHIDSEVLKHLPKLLGKQSYKHVETLVQAISEAAYYKHLGFVVNLRQFQDGTYELEIY